uniref:Uncharacterized protein n=1 Tax=Urocitellus parryii TaxID=9999 RepID=A0A8D2KLZ1_UROPR
CSGINAWVCTPGQQHLPMTAPFDSRFPNRNQTKNCWQNYVDFHRFQKAMTTKEGNVSVCEW